MLGAKHGEYGDKGKHKIKQAKLEGKGEGKGKGKI